MIAAFPGQVPPGAGNIAGVAWIAVLFLGLAFVLAALEDRRG